MVHAPRTVAGIRVVVDAVAGGAASAEGVGWGVPGRRRSCCRFFVSVVCSGGIQGVPVVAVAGMLRFRVVSPGEFIFITLRKM